MQDRAVAASADWSPVRRMRTHEQVLAAVEEQIARGNLRPGDRLPSERELAETLEVSRPSVREALRVLEWMGVVIAGVGSGKDSGSIIAGRPGEALSQLLRLHLSLAQFSLEDVVRTRATLEAAAGAAAAASGNVEPLRLLVEKMADPELEPQEYYKLDTDFHVGIAVASGNRLLMQLMQALRDVIQANMDQSFEQLPDWRSVAESLRLEHQEILNKIAAGDAAGASQRLRDHIEKFYLGDGKSAPRHDHHRGRL